MGHNYAKPARQEGRLAQLFARLPVGWGLDIRRDARDGWSVALRKDNGDIVEIPPQPTILDALEALWRTHGPPA